jgi:tetratricopeptide (TPR) repeat protein
VSFYTDAQENPEEALAWARKDLEIRHSVGAYDGLAWALFRNGNFDEAREMITKALAAGTKDAHVTYHAAMIHLAAGKMEAGKEWLRRTAEINPRYNTFHVHR